ncbi:MAG: PQQ-binding-like beta-propeller repeat protein, partial [Fimbriimonadales bacterium]|nr:PQQ-binding-like beta-propeller repeat protein [Fimbriimonadales bacterium]
MGMQKRAPWWVFFLFVLVAGPRELYHERESSWLRREEAGEFPSPGSDLLMFRGNAERSLSGMGKVPRKPKLLWTFKTSGILEVTAEHRGVPPGTYWAGTDWTGQPAREGDRYYVGSVDSHVYCLDAKTGHLIWKFKTGHNIKGSVTIAGDRLYVGSRDNHLYCLEKETGRLVWKVKTGNDMDSSHVVMDD